MTAADRGPAAAIAMGSAMQVGPYRLDEHLYVPVPTSIDDRTPPGVTPHSRPYWDGLRVGEVRLMRCVDCGRFTHPPVVGCAWCASPRLAAEAVDATATLDTWTLAFLAFTPGMDAPYVTAIVNPVCDPDVQIMTNVVDVDVAEIRMGMTLRPRIVHGSTFSMLFYEPTGGPDV